ncbi:MAG: cytochrome c family protein [Phenylobacterium sp.]|jgi:cytochrome c|uniref:c-type cytochrome n=1 Tax=Phenylobacterium sp. TaxID=1871053 RepID=UPI002A3613F0|nr:cytochrome c family protein [Phenylobacterium sp.]MDX9999179.1 cytochrome c family protein [Phenylobacterium sp.]
MDLTFNKVAGAVLATGLALVGLRELSNGVFATHEVEKPGYAIAIAEETGGGAPQAELPPDWGTVIPAADLAAGQAVFAKCTSCHNITQGGANGTGPNLWGVVGAKPGVHAGFAYSQAMVDHGNAVGVWSWDELDAFIKAPQKHVSGTKMTFVGVKKQEDRVNLIAWMAQQGGTLAVPPPKPPEAAPAEEAPAEGEAAPAEGEAAPAEGEAAPAPEAAPAA